MAKFLLRSFSPGKKGHNKPMNTLMNLSLLGINSTSSILKTSLSIGASMSNLSNSTYPFSVGLEQPTAITALLDITKNGNRNYAYYDLSYTNKRDFLRLFSLQQTIGFVLDTISDETIVNDENNYFALLDIKKLELSIDKTYKNSLVLLDTAKKSFRRVFSMYGWDRNNGAWETFRKWLIEGHIAFEIIFDNLMNPKNIVAFKKIDPSTLEPAIEYDENGIEIRVWYQFKGDADMLRKIPDSNIIYISWSDGGELSTSYIEGLVKSYTLLNNIDESRVVWNVQNAQKRLKISVPVDGLSKDRADEAVNNIKDEWNETVTIDNVSGEILHNGMPNGSWQKTYFVPKRANGEITIDEIAPEGYDLSSVDLQKYFWRRFILDSKLPPNRFMLDPTAESAHTINGDDASITREEYAFGMFKNRLRTIFREIVLKPVYVLICCQMPELSKTEYLKLALGIVFNDENTFAKAKERTALKQDSEIISSLLQIKDSDDKPYFAMDFLIKKYLELSDDDIELNKMYKEREARKVIEAAANQKKHASMSGAVEGQEQEGGDFGGGFGDFGGGGGGDDFGGGAEESGPEPGGDF